MIRLIFAPAFLRQLTALPIDLQEEAIERVELFKHRTNHQFLKVHKLKGSLRGVLSFSVNYRIRILFQWSTSQEAELLAIGDHDVYRD